LLTKLLTKATRESLFFDDVDSAQKKHCQLQFNFLKNANVLCFNGALQFASIKASKFYRYAVHLSKFEGIYSIFKNLREKESKKNSQNLSSQNLKTSQMLNF